jgi:hypothetical protein
LKNCDGLEPQASTLKPAHGKGAGSRSGTDPVDTVINLLGKTFDEHEGAHLLGGLSDIASLIETLGQLGKSLIVLVPSLLSQLL